MIMERAGVSSKYIFKYAMVLFLKSQYMFTIKLLALSQQV